MNIWWLVIVPLSFMWAFPMAGIHQAGAPAWVPVLLALFWCVVALFAEPMYDWGTGVARRAGASRAAALRERLKPRILPAARAGLIVMAAISLVFALL